MRFGLRAKAVEDVNEVKTKLIKSRRIIFTPSVDLKDELANTSIQITCYDRNGEVVKRVTSDAGEVEDPENESPSPNSPEGEGNTNQGGSQQGGSTSPGTVTPEPGTGGDNQGGSGDEG